jgi:hypothetical protein
MIADMEEMGQNVVGGSATISDAGHLHPIAIAVTIRSDDSFCQSITS